MKNPIIEVAIITGNAGDIIETDLTIPVRTVEDIHVARLKEGVKHLTIGCMDIDIPDKVAAWIWGKLEGIH